MENHEAYINSPIGTIHLQEADGFLVVATFMDEKVNASEVCPNKLLPATVRHYIFQFNLVTMRQ